jgi:predicted nucleotide-binding protein
MTKPRVFVGSSSEGLPVAEAVFANMSRDTEPTLWTHQIFTPGAYPLEALEEVMRRHSFAVLDATGRGGGPG